MLSLPQRLAFDGFSAVAAQFSAEVRDGTRIYLPSVAVTVSLEALAESAGANVLGVDVIAERAGLPMPVRFTAVGFGDDLGAAALSAAEQWFAVVFPVFHRLYADHPSDNVGIGMISALDRRTNRHYNWRVFTGPVRVVSRSEFQLPAPDDGAILHALKHEITGLAVSSDAFWLDAFVAVHDDGNVIADCRLMNEQWPEATERLVSVAEDLLNSTDAFESWRQFLFFEPATEATVAPFPVTPRRNPWWRRWLPGASG